MLHMISFCLFEQFLLNTKKEEIIAGKIGTIKEHAVKKTKEDSLAAVSIL